MPMVRKLLRVGTSRGITIPASWLSEIEGRQGKVTEVLLEVDGSLVVTASNPRLHRAKHEERAIK